MELHALTVPVNRTHHFPLNYTLLIVTVRKYTPIYVNYILITDTANITHSVL